MQVAGPGEKLELVERELRDPGPGEVLVRVQACGVCHSDAFTIEGGMPGIEYPRVPGHEIAGRIEAVGDGACSLGGGPARRGRLVRRQLRPLRSVPARRHDQLRQRTGARHRLRRRLRRPRRGAAERAGLDPRRPRPRRTRPRCSARASPPSTRCARAAPAPATSSRSSASAASATSGCSSPAGWASRRWRSPAAPTRRSRPQSLGAHHYIDSTAPTRPTPCRPSAAQRRSWPP